VRILSVLLITLGFLLSLAACQGGPLAPTPTAIPLAATATPSPLPTKPTGMPSAATGALPTTAPAITTLPTATAPASSNSFGLDERLAAATIQGFLDHLAAGNATSALNLYLTDDAKTGEASRMLTQFTEPNAQLLDATLIELLRISDTSYRGQAELHWAGTEDRGPGTQALTLVLKYQGGLWLIDEMALGALQVATPTPTRRPSTSSRARPPDLDGKLVFQASSGGSIYTINADGRGLRRLTDGLDPAWSPNGTQIAFSRWRNPWGVYLIDQDGSGEQRVADNTKPKEVTWSPDGSRLAFTINFSSSEPFEICFFGFCFTIPPYSIGRMWLADLETGKMLSLPLVDRAVHTPTWSPTGARIVYAGDRGLAWIDLEDMGTGRFPGSVWDTSPAFSPDGQRIAFMGRVHNRWEIFVIGADGSGRTQLTSSDPNMEQPPSSVAPAWSPDGKYIAFLSNRDGPWRIYVMRADGSDQHPMFGDKLDDLGFRYEWASERVLSWTR